MNTTQTEDQIEDALQDALQNKIYEVTDLLSSIDEARDVLSGCESVEKIEDFNAECKETVRLLKRVIADIEKLERSK